MKEEIKNNTNGIKEEMKEEMRKMRGEMRQVGQCLQVGKMAAPRAGSSELKGSAPAGEDRVSREMCWTRHEVTERKKLNGVTETCTRHIETREIMSEVTERTETRKMGTVEERLHGTDGVKEAAHTHIELARDNGGELAQRVETRCGQLGVLPRQRREALCPLETGCDQAGPVVPCEFEGKSAADGAREAWGV